ncbi:endonuclease/exonuclease/phosphatase family protein [Sphingomonas jatrophae]|uniref:Metal-dependent hydrolase, endonuclease/exonuclease/phosphatase family n=1 Tax=Sphingomonas jatrophae TaxID=1166337 RepID=A0A1I6KZY1_9SPHN|nr:endonuclease/exonuclease/phosphatase family protein [Sphingomonas jatrophae]SFR96782.1 Metal-dependent hydrolase, endonuclease/exonuclease/phosphatase family [Sphingomonas jatrophae]
MAITADHGTARTRLSVLTYNVEGLGWPARTGRAAKLREIGTRLAALREAGAAPDIVLFQEVFSGAAQRAVHRSGYPAMIPGPGRTTRASADAPAAPLPGKPKLKRGELGLHLVGSGLVTASRYPITFTTRRAFGPRACAGIDCLSNKGVVLARVYVPGLPAPLDIYNTHMNSQAASRAPEARRIAAHERQTSAIAAFVGRTRDHAGAAILAGDFNMKHSDSRWEHFSRSLQLKLVHRICATPAGQCDVRMSWDGDEPWKDTQDLQFFQSGRGVTIRPIKVEALFDGGPSGPALSDHDGFLVTYELSWRVTQPSARCAAD